MGVTTLLRGSGRPPRRLAPAARWAQSRSRVARRNRPQCLGTLVREDATTGTSHEVAVASWSSLTRLGLGSLRVAISPIRHLCWCGEAGSDFKLLLFAHCGRVPERRDPATAARCQRLAVLAALHGSLPKVSCRVSRRSLRGTMGRAARTSNPGVERVARRDRYRRAATRERSRSRIRAPLSPRS